MLIQCPVPCTVQCSSMYSNVTTSTRINSSMYIVHISSVLLACIQQGFVDPKMQHLLGLCRAWFPNVASETLGDLFQFSISFQFYMVPT